MKKNNNNNGNSTKLILLHPYILKQGSPNRLWGLALVSLLSLGFLIYSRASSLNVNDDVAVAASSGLPTSVMNTLLHYASRSNDSFHMSQSEMKTVAESLRKCSWACNLLVFGLTHETLLWKSLNHKGRTMFVDESRYYAAYYEEKHPEIDAYDVQYTTRVKETGELIAAAREQIRSECRPVQNLLFSDCRLGINDLPNHAYEVEWDVILVDGPRGDSADSPGRMAPIFTAGVLARSKKGGAAKTHVLVHDYYRQAERRCGEEFLCTENLVEQNGMIAHFLIDKMDDNTFHYCRPNASS